MHFSCNKIRKLHFIVAAFVILFFYFNNNYIQKTELETELVLFDESKETTPNLNTKYILLWTNEKREPFLHFGEGNTIFRKRNCKFINCYVTDNRRYLDNYNEFDVIIFDGAQLFENMIMKDLPKPRSIRQKFIFTYLEPACNHPIQTESWDKYFNWTWTYKLTSNAVWRSFVIRNRNNHIIGPNINMNWVPENNNTFDKNLLSKLANKHKAAAWFVSNCKLSGIRQKYFQALQQYLLLYNLRIDIYGDCGDIHCPKKLMERCLQDMQQNYFFSLAFEKASSEDYVTGNLLQALEYYTVPIVYGGANYSRFLPPGSYLNAAEIKPITLAKKMYEIIQYPKLYYRFFSWRKHYTYHYTQEMPATDNYCRICSMVNNQKLMSKTSMYSNLSAWWNGF